VDADRVAGVSSTPELKVQHPISVSHPRRWIAAIEIGECGVGHRVNSLAKRYHAPRYIPLQYRP
jgi:hypothetical protein